MSESAYALFCRIRKPIRCLYNIAPIDNVPSIIEHGILSYNSVQQRQHCSIAMNDVQARRTQTVVPNGLPLHDYANVYFNPRNPMMYKRRELADTLCVLAVSAEILDLPGAVVSDGNAASNSTRFYQPYDGLQQIDFVKIFAEWWDDADVWVKRNNKRVECAEALVPYAIPYSFVVAALVVSDSAKDALAKAGFAKRIEIRPEIFFRQEVL